MPYATLCGPRDEVVVFLAEQFGESRKFHAFSDERSQNVEVFANEASGTWTMVLGIPLGETCIVDQGHNWQPVAKNARKGL